jgi:hypothetical protein
MARGGSNLRSSGNEETARQLVRSGAVAAPLILVVRDYLRRMSVGPASVATASFVEAPSQQDRTFVNFAVFGPIVAPRPWWRIAEGSNS